MGGVRARAPRRSRLRAAAWRALPASALCLLAAACASMRSTLHEVQPGENLYRISRYYGVPVATLTQLNGIRNVRDLPVGTRLVIPTAARPQPGHALRPDSGFRFEPAPDDRAAHAHGLAFHWPVPGDVNSGFGRRWGRRHQGIDIRAPRGTEIRAAEAGLVIHSGRGMGAYGRVVILRHAGGFSTVYAHTDRNFVSVGDQVGRGQVIAEVGSSGNASGPHLHFEIRQRRRALDPRSYLPGISRASAPAS